MYYKTIALELLQARPELHNRLRLSRKLLSEVERYATDLRTTHLLLVDTGMETGAALEQALYEIGDRIAREAARRGA